MNPRSHDGVFQSTRRQRGFTLPELTVSMALMVLVTGALVYTNLFGAKMHELTAAKLSTSQEARHVLGRLASEIRSANEVNIGTVSGNVFTAIAATDPQVGGAVRIFDTAGVDYVCYYRDAASHTLRRCVNAINSGVLVAEYVTNSIVFAGQDYRGTNSTALQIYPIVQVSLEFSHGLYGNPGSEAQRVQSRITRRVR